MEVPKIAEGFEGIGGRKPLHTRRITCTAYVREDGLLEIEGILIDVKPFDFPLRERGSVPAGEPIHEIGLRIVLDWQLVIHDAAARFEHSPYRVCREIEDHYRKLVGIQIKPGFGLKVKALFKGAKGCTHLTELLGSIATTAIQARVSAAEPGDAARAYPVDGCHTFRRDGELVKAFYPELYRPGN